MIRKLLDTTASFVREHGDKRGEWLPLLQSRALRAMNEARGELSARSTGPKAADRLTMVMPYYRNPGMLRVQLDNLRAYRVADRVPGDALAGLTFIIVDDGSPEPAANVVSDFDDLRGHLRLYRILDDKPWNQHGARNLGAREADDGWLFMLDIDRLVLKRDMQRLRARALNPHVVYKPRAIHLRAPLPASCRVATNCFLCTKAEYWLAGGYDEDYCGYYGGDVQFLEALRTRCRTRVLEDVVCLRYDRHFVPDATTTTLDRNDEAFKALRDAKVASGRTQAVDPIRFRWERLM